MGQFRLKANISRRGSAPAIDRLVEGLNKGYRHQTL